MEKRTERNFYELYKEIVLDGRTLTDEDVDQVVEFCDKKIGQIDAKGVKAKEYRAKKVAEDTLADEIFDVLAENPLTIPEIITALDVADITPQKVGNRLGKLVAAGKVVTTKITVGGDDGTKKRKINGYSIA